MDPYSPLPPSASCRNGQHETAKALEGLLTNCCKIITFTVPCDMVDQTRRWREIHGQKGTLRCRGRRRVVPLDQGRGYRGRRESCGGEKRPGSSNNREREVRWIEEVKFPLSSIVSVTGSMSPGTRVERLRSDHEETYIHSRAPLHGTNLLVERPAFHFTANDDLPKRHDTFLVRADNPSTIWAD